VKLKVSVHVVPAQTGAAGAAGPRAPARTSTAIATPTAPVTRAVRPGGNTTVFRRITPAPLSLD